MDVVVARMKVVGEVFEEEEASQHTRVCTCVRVEVCDGCTCEQHFRC
jgi:hypothetical protein